MSDGQYTLDASPMVLAERCRKLEMCCDSLSACLVELMADQLYGMGEQLGVVRE